MKRKQTNTNLLAGEIHIIESWNLIKSTTSIPNKIGTEFGVAYVITAPFYKDSIEIEEIMIFPNEGLTNPTNGRSAKIDSELLNIKPSEEQYFSYTFDYPWEVKSGTWLFQVK